MPSSEIVPLLGEAGTTLVRAALELDELVVDLAVASKEVPVVLTPG